MTTIATTTAAKSTSKDLKDAQILMTRYARLNKSRQDLLDSIMEQLRGYEGEMKETQKQLIEIGERNKAAFNNDGNLELNDGYLHIAKVTEVLTRKKFDLADFYKKHPDFVDVTLKVSPIKKAFLDKDQRKELTALGVDVTTSDKVEVKLRKAP